MEPFKLDLTPQPSSDSNLKIVRLDGKLALENVHNFIATMRAETAPRLVLDMSGVSFLDSAGVGALVQLFVHRKALGQKFSLAGLTPQGRAVMEVSGLMKLLPIYDGLAEAHAAGA